MMDSNGWITDRLPTAEDEGYHMVWVWERYKSQEYATLRDYIDVRPGTPWQRVPQPPPYVKPKWKPKEGEEYWYVDSSHVCTTTWDRLGYAEQRHYSIGNCFQTKEEAEEVFEKFKQLLKEHHDGK